MNNNNYTEEQINELSNLGNGARPSEIRAANSILNQRGSETREQLENINKVFSKLDFGKLGEGLGTLEKNIQKLAKSTDEADKLRAQEMRNLRSDLQLTKEKHALDKEYSSAVAKLTKVLNDENATRKEVAEAYDKVSDVVDDFKNLQATVNAANKNMKDFSDAVAKRITNENRERKAESERRANQRKEYNKTTEGLEKTGGQSEIKARAKEWKELGNTIKGVVDTLNISKLANTFAPTARQTLQQSMQMNFNLSRGEFNTFKKDLFNQINTSEFTTDEVLDVMQTLASSPIGNAQTATQYFNDLIRGQKLLGMSAQSQESLLKLGNITGRNELKFYTGQFAKYMSSNLNLNSKQLDELVNMNANLAMQAADIGIASEAFNEMTLNQAAAFESTGAGYGAKYNQFITKAMQDDTLATTVFGMSAGELAQYLKNGGDPLALIKGNSGSTAATYQWMKTASAEDLQNRKLYASQEMGIDDNTWSLMMFMAKHEDELTKNLTNATEASRKDAEEAMKTAEQKRLDSMTTMQKTINSISNFIAKNDDWVLESALDNITNLLSIAVALLGAQTAFGNLKELFGGAGGKALLGKLGIGGAGAGAGTGAGLGALKIGAATGGAALGSIAAILGGLAIGGYDAYKMRNEQNGGALRGFFLGTGHATATEEENFGSIMGNAGKWGLIGAGVGTLFAPGIGTAIGGGIGAIAGLIMGGIGALQTSEEKSAEEQTNELEKIRKATYATAQNTSYQGTGAVYRYRGISNYSSMGSATSRATGGMGDLQYPVTSRFGPREPLRVQDGRITSSFHAGTDFGAPEGTPLYSNVTGTVIGAGTMKDGTNYVAVQSDKDGYIHWYAHMQKPPVVKKGQHVSQGEFVGYVGHTGMATGPHLHYSVTKPGSGMYLDADHAVDSLPFATESIFGGGASSSGTDSTKTVDLSSAFRTQAIRVSASRLGDVATPIVNSIGDLKQTIVNLSEQTSRNQKIMDALVNKTMVSPTI